MELLEFLNKNSGALMVLFTVVVTISTVVYARLTAKLVTETRKMRQAQTDPKMEVVFKPREEYINFVNLYIRNIGLGPAYDVRFQFKAVSSEEEANKIIERFKKCNFFYTGFKYLAPNQEITSDYIRMEENFQERIKASFDIQVEYFNAARKKYSDTFHINLAELKGRTQLGKPPIYSMAKDIEKIRKDFGQLVSGFRRLRTDIYTSDDRKKEEEADEEMLAEQENKKP